MHLQNLKAPWVDECYSYYGVLHDNFSEFYDSMLTGINFSPPLYFFLNFLIQCIQPTSIELLRLQSLAWIIIGIILTYFCSRKVFDSTSSILATMLVLAQSNILLAQAQEARHYAMFFASGAWVLYIQSLNDLKSRKYTWHNFLSHICLCQVHYLGIIFSFLSGIAYFLTSKNKGLWKRIPTSIILCWLLSIASYLFYLTQQKSVLNTWPKPNHLSDLLAGYKDSLQILTIIIPIFVYIMINKSDSGRETRSIEEIGCSRSIMITSLLWLSVPLLFWILSHLTSLNLFVDRYFIPKEAALIYLVAYGFSLIFKKLPKIESMRIPILGAFTISVVLVLVSTKRNAFGLNKDTNYHHSLIFEESYPSSKQPIILEGDPKYFPNAYLNRNEYFFLIKDKDLIKTYSQFSRKINLVDHKK